MCDYVVKLVTYNQIVYDGACILLGVAISGDGAVGDADVYDGVNATEEAKLHLEVGSGTTSPVIPDCDTKMNKGIYVVVNAATTKAMVIYRLPHPKLEVIPGA